MTYPISIITVCYNEPNLEATCESIVAQTEQNFEWIVVDGGSDEKTQRIWQKYRHRINKFVSEKDSGIYNAMNKGIRLATGEYLLFLNAGDAFEDSEVINNVIKMKLDRNIVYGDVRPVGRGDGKRIQTFPDFIERSYWIRHTICHNATFIKKSLFDKFGLYDETLRIVADGKKWLEFFLLRNCSYKHISLTVTKFDENGVSTDPKRRWLLMKEREIILKNYFSQKEIKREENRVKYNNVWERLFSVKNDWNKRTKVLTVVGLKFRFKRRLSHYDSAVALLN
jgi:glycosyltransferase involved in cell wall biosynthesis